MRKIVILLIAAVGAWLLLRKNDEPAAAAPVWGGLKSGVIPGSITTPTGSTPSGGVTSSSGIPRERTTPSGSTPSGFDGIVYSGTSGNSDTLPPSDGGIVAAAYFSKPKRKNTW